MNNNNNKIKSTFRKNNDRILFQQSQSNTITVNSKPMRPKNLFKLNGDALYLVL